MTPESFSAHDQKLDVGEGRVLKAFRVADKTWVNWWSFWLLQTFSLTAPVLFWMFKNLLYYFWFTKSVGNTHKTKTMPFWPLCCESGHRVARAKLFCLKSFVSVNRAGVFTRNSSHLGYRDLGFSTGQHSFSYEHIENCYVFMWCSSTLQYACTLGSIFVRQRKCRILLLGKSKLSDLLSS